MKQKTLLQIPLICAALLLMLAPTFITSSLPPPNSLSPLENSLDPVWGDLFYPDFNALLTWRLDPWIIALTKALALFYSPGHLYELSCLTIIFIGLLSFSYFTLASPLTTSIITSSITITTIFLTNSTDLATLAALSWVPLGATLLSTASSNWSLSYLAFYILILLRLSTSANHLFIISISSLVFIPLTFKRLYYLHSKLPLYSFFILALFAYLYLLNTAPSITTPDYPNTARVVIDDGIPGITRPLLGLDTQIALINRAAVTAKYLPLGIYITLVSFLFLIVSIKSRSTHTTQPIYCALFLGSAVMWDSLPLEKIAQIGPLASLSRMLPNLFIYPLSPFFFSLSVITLGLTIQKLNIFKYLLPLLLLIYGVVISSQQNFFTVSIFSGLRIEATRSPGHLEKFSWDKSLRSPSHYVATFFGEQLLTLSANSSFSTPVRVRNEILSINSNRNQELLPLLSDNNISTRYTTGPGGQTGEEYITIKFKRSFKLLGISLDVGKFVTDFPRGIIVQDCSTNPEPSERSYPTLSSFPSWQGPPSFTSDGYPYFGGQEDVRIPFHVATTVSCLKIIQTGISTRFDWSIAELGLLIAE